MHFMMKFLAKSGTPLQHHFPSELILEWVVSSAIIGLLFFKGKAEAKLKPEWTAFGGVGHCLDYLLECGIKVASYYSIASSSIAELREFAFKFYAFAYPISSEDEA
jgi:hypothetical protein